MAQALDSSARLGRDVLGMRRSPRLGTCSILYQHFAMDDVMLGLPLFRLAPHWSNAGKPMLRLSHGHAARSTSHLPHDGTVTALSRGTYHLDRSPNSRTLLSSGFTTAVPTHCKQYSHSARNFIVESRAANWVRRGWDGAVLLNNLVNCIPLVIDSIDGHFEQTIAPQLRAQLLELSADPALMVRRATSIDPYTFINRANKTQAAVLWRRLFAHQSELPLSVRRRTPSGSDQST